MNEEKKFCKKCGQELEGDSTFCPKCGQNKNEEIKHSICTGCGVKLPYGYTLCEDCNQIKKKDKYRNAAVLLLIVSILIYGGCYIAFTTLSDLGSKLGGGVASTLPWYSKIARDLSPCFLFAGPTFITSTVFSKRGDMNVLWVIQILIIIIHIIMFGL